MKIKLLFCKPPKNTSCFEYKPGYVFDSNPDCRDYDWLVVYDEMSGVEHLACPQERTILLTWEPVSIKCYTHAYAAQFGYLLSNRPPEAERHPRYRLGRGYYLWFDGRTYQELKSTVIPPKTRDLSAICSAKRMRWTMHSMRYNLVKRIIEGIPGSDWFGHGVREFDAKWKVSDPYRYQLVVENHIAPHYWTEKIADAILSESLPFYAGDPLLCEVLPKEAFIPIPIDDTQEALHIIRDAIARGEYERRIDAIREAKKLLLQKYNLWQQIIDVIESADVSDKTLPRQAGILYPRRHMRVLNASAMLESAVFHVRQYLSGIGVCKRLT